MIVLFKYLMEIPLLLFVGFYNFGTCFIFFSFDIWLITSIITISILFISSCDVHASLNKFKEEIEIFVMQ